MRRRFTSINETNQFYHKPLQTLIDKVYYSQSNCNTYTELHYQNKKVWEGIFYKLLNNETIANEFASKVISKIITGYDHLYNENYIHIFVEDSDITPTAQEKIPTTLEKLKFMRDELNQIIAQLEEENNAELGN